jgi:hypothetical protein
MIGYLRIHKLAFALCFILVILSLPVRCIEIVLEQRPIFLFHAWRGSCENQENLPWECIETGAGLIKSSDCILEQAKKACSILESKMFEDGVLKKEYQFGIHLIGRSQGGLIARALFHFCPKIRPLIRRILTFGTPHLGINRHPNYILAKIGIILLQFVNDEENLKKNWSFYQYLNIPNSKNSQNPEDSPYESSPLIQSLLNKVTTGRVISLGNKKLNDQYLKIYDKLEAMINIEYALDKMLDDPRSAVFGVSYDPKATGNPFSEFDPVKVSERVGLFELSQKKRLVSCVINADHLKVENEQQYQEQFRFVLDSMVYDIGNKQDTVSLRIALYDQQFEDGLVEHPLENLACSFQQSNKRRGLLSSLI